MNERDIGININTSATGTGAQDAREEIEALTASTAEHAEMQDDLGSSVAQASQEMARQTGLASELSGEMQGAANVAADFASILEGQGSSFEERNRDQAAAQEALRGVTEDETQALRELVGEVESAEEILEGLRAKTEELAEEFEDVTEETQETSDGLDDVTAGANRLRRAALGAALTAAASGAASLGGELLEAGENMSEFDEEAGQMLQTVGRNTQEIGRFTATVAAGFAVGGPVGAGLGAVVAGFQGVARSIAEAAEVSRRVAAGINTDWQRSADQIEETTAATDRYRAALQRLNDEQAEESRLLRETFDQARALRDVQLELAERAGEVRIGEIRNGDLPEEEQNRLIGIIRDELSRARGGNEVANAQESGAVARRRIVELRNNESDALDAVEGARRQVEINPAAESKDVIDQRNAAAQELADTFDRISGVLSQNSVVFDFLNTLGGREATGFTALSREIGEASILRDDEGRPDQRGDIDPVLAAGALRSAIAQFEQTDGLNIRGVDIEGLREALSLSEGVIAGNDSAAAATAASDLAAANLASAQEALEAATTALNENLVQLETQALSADARVATIPGLVEGEVANDQQARANQQVASRAAAQQRQNDIDDREQRLQDALADEARQAEAARQAAFTAAAGSAASLGSQSGVPDRAQQALNNAVLQARDGVSDEEQARILNLLDQMTTFLERQAGANPSADGLSSLQAIDQISRRVAAVESRERRSVRR